MHVNQAEPAQTAAQDLHSSGFKALPLYQLAESLNKQSLPTDTPDYHLFPSVWSYPLTFEWLVYEKRSTTARLKWQAVLALLALGPCYHFKLQSHALQLPQNGPFSWPLKASPASTKKTHEPLYNLVCDQQSLAFSWPSLLFCPTENLPAVEVPWIQEGNFLPPFAVLPPEESWGLLHWLSQTHLYLQQHFSDVYFQPWGSFRQAPADLLLAFMHEGIQQLLASKAWHYPEAQLLQDPLFFKNRYQDRILPALQAQLIEQGPLQTSSLNTDTAGNPRYTWSPFYGFLTRQVQVTVCPAECSPLRLKARLTELPDALILSDQIPPELASTYTRVYRQYTLDMLLQASQTEPDRHRFCGKRNPNLQWLTAADLFSEELVFFPADHLLPAPEHDIWGYHDLFFESQNMLPLLPVKPIIFDYFSPEELMQSLSFEQDNEQTVSVYLRLRLGPSQQECILQKEFPLVSENLLEHIPVVRLWPYLNAPQLKAYYLYFDAEGQTEQTFFISPCLPAWARPQLTVRAYDELRKRLTEATHNQADMLIYHLPCVPEALACYRDPLQHDILGCLLIPAPPRARAQAHAIDIAIDFGTSSTNVCLSHQGEQTFLELNPAHILDLTQTLMAPNIYHDFITDKALVSPFLTLFYTLDPEQVSNLGPEILLEGHIYFLQTIHTLLLQDNVQTDLKWGYSQQGLYLKAFLLQICMHAALEALQQNADQIRFYFSYPHAFSYTDKMTFQVAAEQVLQKIQQHFCTAVCLPETADTANRHFLSEGLAAAHFFAQSSHLWPAANFQRGVVILDIGGGTTDLTIIQGRENAVRLSNSLMFAGREIFLKRLQIDLAVLAEIGIPADLLSVSRQYTTDSAWFTHIEALLQEYRQEIYGYLRYRWGTPRIKQMIASLAFAVAGIFYYVGLCIAYLYKTENYSQDKLLPTFYIGGNGARIFDWFFIGQDKRAYLRLFQQALSAWHLPTYSAHQELEIHLSPVDSGAKPEVVSGLLLAQKTDIFTQTHQPPRYPLGEKVQLQQDQDSHITLKAMSLLAKEDFLHLVLNKKALPLAHFEALLQLYKSWLQGFYPEAAQNLDTAAVLQATRQQVLEELQGIQSELQQNSTAVNQLRDEQALLIVALRHGYRNLYNPLSTSFSTKRRK